PGDRGQPERLLHGLTEASTRHAVAAGVEGRTGDQEIGRVAADPLDDGPDGLVLTLAEEVVPAGDCGHDFGFISQTPLQHLSRSHHSVATPRAFTGLVLTA